MEKDVSATNPNISPNRHSVTQDQIDDVLDNELKDYAFPVKPIYNPWIRANGLTKGEIYKWGQLKRIVSIEIGKQDKPDRDFLIDTLLHEFYEADIMAKQYDVDFYRKLYRAGDEKRHAWINSQIAEFFRKLEERL